MSNDPMFQALMNRFDHLEDRMEERFDKVEDNISRIDKTLVKQNADIEHHIRRTDLNEERLELQQQSLEAVNEEQNKRLSATETFMKELGIYKKWVQWVVGSLIAAGILDRIVDKFF